MHLPEIPETATEAYLEKLTEKIFNQLERATNRNVRLRLTTLLQEVQRRKKKLLRETSKKDSNTSKYETIKMFDTANLSPEEQAKIKDRLRNVLEDINKQRPASQQYSFNHSSQEDEPAATSPHALLDIIELSEHEYDIVKERMKGMLAEVEQRREEALNKENDEDDIILLEDEILFEEDDLAEETEPEESDVEIQVGEPKEPSKEVFSFEVVCRKVKTGEALALFDHITLTEREQAMLEAFHGHTNQTKGLKRQQVFEIKHITTRSIRELDQILKTYQPQGYLSVELHNIYKRLLGLRSRISILIS